MSDDLRAWLGEQRIIAEWAREPEGEIMMALIAKIEELAGALEMCKPIVQQYTREATGVPVIEKVESALRAPGGVTDGR